MKSGHKHEPDGLPAELWKELEGELPEHVPYLRRIRARLASCDSEMVSADTGLSTATAVAGFRATRRQPWWHLAAACMGLVVTISGAAWNLNSEADRRQKAQVLETVGIMKKQNQWIANMVHQEQLAARDSNSWRVPHKIRLQQLPAGTYQIMETNPDGESRWVSTEIAVERPQWLPIRGN